MTMLPDAGSCCSKIAMFIVMVLSAGGIAPNVYAFQVKWGNLG